MSSKLGLPIESLSDIISDDAFKAHQEAVELLESKKQEMRDPTSIDIDNASVDDLRFLIKHLMDAKTRTDAIASSPLGIDAYSNLPVHFEPPECPVCLPFTMRNDEFNRARPVCHDCSEIIPYEKELLGHGVESHSITHAHLHTVAGSGGGQIRIPYRRELCRPCYEIDFKNGTGKDWPGWYWDTPLAIEIVDE